MATFAVVSDTTVLSTPFEIHKLTCTGGATSLAYTHGKAYGPDLILSANTTEGAALGAVGAARTSATVLTLDTLVDSATACEVYLVWFPQGSGGLAV